MVRESWAEFKETPALCLVFLSYSDQRNIEMKQPWLAWVQVLRCWELRQASAYWLSKIYFVF